MSTPASAPTPITSRAVTIVMHATKPSNSGYSDLALQTRNETTHMNVTSNKDTRLIHNFTESHNPSLIYHSVN